MPLRGRKSRRDELLANKATLDFLAAATDQPADPFLTRIPAAPKPRQKKLSADSDEGSTNDQIRAWMRRIANVILYRNNRGQVKLDGGGRLTYGTGPNGASDWIGYASIEVTAAMVGKTVAVFMAVEAKRLVRGHVESDQERFIEGVRAAGGIAGVARSAEEADALLQSSLLALRR